MAAVGIRDYASANLGRGQHKEGNRGINPRQLESLPLSLNSDTGQRKKDGRGKRTLVVIQFSIWRISLRTFKLWSQKNIARKEVKGNGSNEG